MKLLDGDILIYQLKNRYPKFKCFNCGLKFYGQTHSSVILVMFYFFQYDPRAIDLSFAGCTSVA